MLFMNMVWNVDVPIDCLSTVRVIMLDFITRGKGRLTFYYLPFSPMGVRFSVGPSVVEEATRSAIGHAKSRWPRWKLLAERGRNYRQDDSYCIRKIIH